MVLFIFLSFVIANQQADIGRLAFERLGDIYVIELPNRQPTRITRTGRNSKPQWSDTGDWVMFRKATDAGAWVSVIQRDGSRLHEFKRDYSACWVRKRNAIYLEHDDALWVASAPTWREHRLMKIPGKERHNLHIGGCNISPDGKWAAFSRYYVGWNKEGSEYSVANEVLCSVRSGGAHSRRLESAHNHEELFPHELGWTPDSRYILYWRVVHRAASGNRDGSELYAISPHGGKRIQLTQGEDGRMMRNLSTRSSFRPTERMSRFAKADSDLSAPVRRHDGLPSLS